MLDIVKIPTPSLRERSRELEVGELNTPEIKKLIADMIPTMYGDDGIGLAAPQVGVNIRIFSIGKDAIPKRHKIWKSLGGEWRDLIFINPEWGKTSKKTTTEMEGCLSVPGVFGKVKRWKDIEVTAQDSFGEKFTFDASNFFARVIQHETDHLNGILFIDKASDLETAEHVDQNQMIDLLKSEGVHII